jgi:TM2 domain-containing membrane protein YozV
MLQTRLTALLSLLILMLMFAKNTCANTRFMQVENFNDEIQTLLEKNNMQQFRPNPLLSIFKKKQNKNKKITAVILAFPLPFGIVGLHRIYMGCSPHIPVVYIASLGGAFGILPLVDFFVLLKEEDISKYYNSTKVFMWVE